MSADDVAAMQHDIHLFRVRLIQFILTPGLLAIPWLPFGLIFGESLLARVKGPNGETQTVQQFEYALDREYDLLFLGNSHIYRGINPDRFSVPAFNFASDNDTFNQMYFKLKWLRDQGREISHLAMGIDFFQYAFLSDKKNYLYSRYFDEAYLEDYKEKPFAGVLRQFNKRIRALNPKYLFMSPKNRPFLRENGQYICPGVAKVTDSVVRRTRRLPIQLKFFEKILQDCEEHGTGVTMCMLPIRDAEQRAYEKSQIEEFMGFIMPYTSENVDLIDLTFDDNYKMTDYTDITHLNEAAAEQLSVQLDGLITPTLRTTDSRSRIVLEGSDSLVQ